MNRRGAMEIVLLVLLVLLVTSAALFTFGVNPSSAKVNVYNVRFVENVYQKQDLAEFYIKQVGEDVLDKSGESDFKENFKIEFGKYDFEQENLKELQKIISEDRFNVRELGLAPKGVSQGGTSSSSSPSVKGDVNTEGKVLEIQINSWEIPSYVVSGTRTSNEVAGDKKVLEVEDSFEKIKVSYFPKISVKFDLED